MNTLRKQVSEWDTVEWKTTRAGNQTATVLLNAGEYFHIEEGWEIDGPIRVSFTWIPKDRITRARYRRLRKKEFDLDNPQEYPCLSCGADRKSPCIGDKAECTFRVFFLAGGKL